MRDRDPGTWWPLNHWTDQKIKVHGLYCTLAVLFRALLHHRLKQADVNISMKRMLRELGDIREVVNIYPRKRRSRKERTQTVLTRRSDLQQQLVTTLNLAN